MTKLFVDGNSVGWRAYHAMSAAAALSDADGNETGMAFGFLRLLRDAAAQVQASEVRVAWDGGRPAFRLALLPTYKAKRDGGDPEREARRAAFHAQQAWLAEVLPLLGVGQLRCAGWEADDILAMWVEQDRVDPPVVLMSGDRDLWQLVGRGVSVLRPDGDGDVLLTAKNFATVTKHESPARWFWYRVLTGDGSDGVPGVGGIGPKRGAALIADGWPWRSNGGAPTPLAEPQRANMRRNYALMNLRAAAERLEKTEFTPETCWPVVARRNLSAARRLLDAARMHSLTARWTEWAEPFRQLRAP